VDPLVSIIIPNYNHASFLQERLNSVFQRTYTNIEVIILDDASTDGSRNIIEQYQNHPKVYQTVFNTSNSGSPFLQWKKGIELTRGKYIWIAESDDAARVNFLEILVSILERNTSLMLAYCDSERDETSWRKFAQVTGTEPQVFRGDDFVNKKMLTSPAIVNASAVLFRKDAISNQVMLETVHYKSVFDWLFLVRYLLAR